MSSVVCATNGVASQPPERRPIGTQTARAKIFSVIMSNYLFILLSYFKYEQYEPHLTGCPTKQETLSLVKLSSF